MVIRIGVVLICVYDARKTMGKIIAIGGGDIGRPREGGGFYPVETTAIDKEIVAQTGKRNPALLFLPTASGDSKDYAALVQRHFSRLGCTVDTLYLLENRPPSNEIEQRILAADAVYVGGGNTLRMMTLWRKLGVDDMLRKAYGQGVVLSGVSAGSICWFSYGNSDSRSFTSGSNQLIKVAGLGLIDALHCPHCDVEEHRQADLRRMMKTTHRLVAIALENCCALEVIDNQFRILQSKPHAKAYKLYWRKGQYCQEEIPCKREFEAVEVLLRKETR